MLEVNEDEEKERNKEKRDLDLGGVQRQNMSVYLLTSPIFQRLPFLFLPIAFNSTQFNSILFKIQWLLNLL